MLKNLNMKKLLSLCVIFGLSWLSAQGVSDYKFLYVPKKFTDFEVNQYQLNTLLKEALQAKKYIVIQAEIQNWPSELRLNPCLVATAELLDDSSMLRTKVLLRFTDCNSKVLGETKASSFEKDFDLGFQEALKTALEKVPSSAPKPIATTSIVDIKEDLPPVNEQEIKEEIKKEEPAATSKKTEMYVNGSLRLLKIHLSESQFILVNSSIPFATFKKTTKNEVFRVVLENGTSTLGYSENGNLVIEMPAADGNYQKMVFEKK